MHLWQFSIWLQWLATRVGHPPASSAKLREVLAWPGMAYMVQKNEALKDWSNSMWWILVMDRKAETSSHQRSKYLYADMFLVLVGIFRINSHLFSEIWTLFPIESSFSDEFWTCYWGFIPWPWVCMARSRWLLGHTFGLRTRRFGIFVWVLKIQNPSLQVLKMSTWRALI